MKEKLIEFEDLNQPIKGKFDNSIWLMVKIGLGLILFSGPLYIFNIALANWLLPDAKDAESVKQVINATALFMGTGGAGTALLGARGMINRSLEVVRRKADRQADEHRVSLEIGREAAKKTNEPSETSDLDVTDLDDDDEVDNTLEVDSFVAETVQAQQRGEYVEN